MQDPTFAKAWWRRGRARAGSSPVKALEDLYEGVRRHAAADTAAGRGAPPTPAAVPADITSLIAKLDSEVLCARFTKIRYTGQAPEGIGMSVVAYNGCIWVLGGLLLDCGTKYLNLFLKNTTHYTTDI